MCVYCQSAVIVFCFCSVSMVRLQLISSTEEINFCRTKLLGLSPPSGLGIELKANADDGLICPVAPESRSHTICSEETQFFPQIISHLKVHAANNAPKIRGEGVVKSGNGNDFRSFFSLCLSLLKRIICQQSRRRLLHSR